MVKLPDVPRFTDITNVITDINTVITDITNVITDINTVIICSYGTIIPVYLWEDIIGKYGTGRNRVKGYCGYKGGTVKPYWQQYNVVLGPVPGNPQNPKNKTPPLR